MAGVTINTGPVDYRDRLDKNPKDKWSTIFSERRLYISAEFQHGCRCVIDWLAEAEEFHDELGYESADEMLREELNIPPDWVRMAAAVLEASGENLSKAEVDQAIELKAHGRPKKGEEIKGDQITLKRGTTGADYIKARLRRDHPEIAEELERGEHRSARAAGIAAGFIKDVPTIRMADPVKAAKLVHSRLDSDFLKQFLAELLKLSSSQS
tara:strand:- start:213 stop:845 length:633 start_codon:yes stop_codon:yes gene_type:complete